MAGAQNDIIDIQDKVSDLETLTEFLLAEQSLQDQRIFALEQGSVSTQEDIEGELNIHSCKAKLTFVFIFAVGSLNFLELNLLEFVIITHIFLSSFAVY